MKKLNPPQSDCLLDWALFYALLGWPVLPLHSIMDGLCTCGDTDCDSPGKHPQTLNGVRDSSTDARQIREWWEQWPHANIGVATGSVSGLYVIDIDPRNGGDDAFYELCNELGPLPETPEVLTGGGGRHLYFRQTSVPPRIRARLVKGVDVRTDGGYVVAPPSKHSSGRQYVWEASTEGIDPVALPSPWLVRITEGPPGLPTPTPAVELVEGDRDNGLTSLGGKLRYAGLDEAELLPALLVANERRCYPPLSSKQVEKIARSVGRYAAGQIQATPSFPLALDLSEFIQQEHHYPESIIGNGLLIPGGLALLAGRPGIGKTWLTLDLALVAMTGGLWLDDEALQVRQRRVALISMELPAFAIHQRLLRLLSSKGMSSIPPSRGWVLPEPPAGMVSLSTPQGQENLRRFVERHELELLLLDPFSRFHASDENAAKDVGEVLGILDGLRHETGCAIVLVHHVRKSGDQTREQGGLDSVRGSSRLISDPQTVLLFRKLRAGYCLTSEKVNLGPALAARWFSKLDEGGFSPSDPPVDRHGARDDGRRWLCDALRASGLDGLSAEEIEQLPDAPEVKRATLLGYLRDLKNAGQATSTGGRKNCRWIWAGDDPSDS